MYHPGESVKGCHVDSSMVERLPGTRGEHTRGCHACGIRTGMGDRHLMRSIPIAGNDSRSIRMGPARRPAQSAALDHGQSSGYSQSPRRTGLACILNDLR
jgi:hypothetical protein